MTGGNYSFALPETGRSLLRRIGTAVEIWLGEFGDGAGEFYEAWSNVPDAELVRNAIRGSALARSEFQNLPHPEPEEVRAGLMECADVSLELAFRLLWLTERGDATGNVNAILIADPKREALPGTGANGSTGPFGPFVGAPLAGTDSFFGSVPVKSICNWDYICDSSANPLDYPHNYIVNYGNDWDGNHHNDEANEYWWNNQWFPR